MVGHTTWDLVFFSFVNPRHLSGTPTDVSSRCPTRVNEVSVRRRQSFRVGS